VEDVLVEKSSIFSVISVRSAYKVALQSQPVQWDFPVSLYLVICQPVLGKIWRASVPPKVKVFAWK
jgi:hypothetical protein